MDDIEMGGKKAALEHILKKFVPSAKKAKIMSRVKPDVDHSGLFDDEEESTQEPKDDDLVDAILAKLSAKYPEE